MAFRPPRQRTTFDKKGKGTTTYRAPEKEKADEQLDRYIRDNQDKKNEAAGISSILQDMPKKNADFVRRQLEKTGGKRLNEAAKSMLSFYADDRPEYSRGLNRLVQSSPEMQEAYARRFPIANAMQNIIPRFMPGIGPLFTADQGMKANRRKQEILNTPVNRPDGGFKNFVDFFKPKMNAEQTANTEIIEGETKPLVSPTDMNLQKAKSFVSPQDMNLQEAAPFRSPQDMGFLDDENIFDSEKAAIEEALTPGNVFNPVAAEKQSKVDFINQVENTNFTVEGAEQRFNIDEQFERSKQKQGLAIGETVDAGNAQEGDTEDPIPGGQFDLTNPAFSDQTNLVLSGDPEYDFSNFNTNAELGSLSQDPNSFPEGGVSGTPVTQAGQQLFFADGTPVTEPVDTGINTPAGQAAVEILNSNAVPATPSNNYSTLYQDLIAGPNPTTDLMMQNPDLSLSDINDLAGGLSGGAYGGSPDFGYFADGGSTNKYENMSTHEKLMRMAAEMYG